MPVSRKLIVWLVIVLIPVAVASVVAIETIDHRLSERIETDLMNTRRLEAKRITEALSNAQRNVASLAKESELVNLVANRHSGDAATTDFSTLSQLAHNYGNDAILPLQSLAASLAEKTRAIDSDIVELHITDTSGKSLAKTEGFTWNPTDINKLIADAVSSRMPVFGRAFNSPVGEHRYGMAAPIFNESNTAVGLLFVEARLEPVVGLVVEHEGFGETSEAHLAQPTATGDAEFITLLRFKRDAAFNKIVPKSKNLPINWSLTSPGGRLVRSPDYRSIDSILAIETLPETGWGLVVKIDAEEAFQPVAEVRRVVLYSAAFLLVTIIFGWMLFLRPLGGRLRILANASARIAGGDYKIIIGDGSADEIGETSRSIDDLSTALIHDKQLRAVAEEKLQFQANNDQLTGLFNRTRGHEIIAALDENENLHEHKAILFLDLNKFKAINDTYGHAVGDEILVVVAQKLQEVVSEKASIIRWGGDEFVVIVVDEEAEKVEELIERLEAVFSKPFQLSRGEFSVGCSIGLSKPGSSDQSLLNCLNEADSNMYENKRSNNGMSGLDNDVDKLVADAIRDSRVQVLFQPIVDVGTPSSMRLLGVEALARFISRQGELITPGGVIPHLRSEEVKAQLDTYVMQQSIDAISVLQNKRTDFDHLFLSLNVTGDTLASNYFGQALVEKLSSMDITAERIYLEVSEGDELASPQPLAMLREKGVKLALNNFGQEHSTIDRLESLDADIIKYNQQALVEEIVNTSRKNNTAFALLKAFLLQNYTLIATNVETLEQMNELKQLGIHYQQGFLFGGAITGGAFASQWPEPVRTMSNEELGRSNAA